MRYGPAIQIARSLVEHLRPACTRIEIAGSVRRGKGEVKDIEIVAVPDLVTRPRFRAEFGKPAPKYYIRTQLDQVLMEMENIEICKFGDRYKQIYLKYAGISLDLFLVLPPAQWGVQMVIRTGPKEFGQWMVTRQCYGGALPNEYIVQDGVVGRRVKGEKGDVREGEIAMPEELDFLQFCSLSWIDPAQRRAGWPR